MTPSLDYVQVLCMQKLGKDYWIENDPDIVLKAAKHNLREIISEMSADSTSKINPKLSRKNVILRGKSSALEVVAEMERIMFVAGAKVKRRDQIRGVEYIYSLPSNLQGNPIACFEAFVDWLEMYFSDIPILSAVAHFDEPRPHVHVILLPLVDGKLQGHKVMGNAADIKMMHESCYQHVGAKFGLKYRRQDNHGDYFGNADAMDILNELSVSPEKLNDPKIREFLLKLFSNDADTTRKFKCLLLNGGRIRKRKKTKKRTATFVGIMTKPCKPDRIYYK